MYTANMKITLCDLFEIFKAAGIIPTIVKDNIEVFNPVFDNIVPREIRGCTVKEVYGHTLYI